MPIEIKVLITANENGICTSMEAEGVCSSEEAEHLEFIYVAINSALKKREGQCISESDNFIQINNGGHHYVH